MQVLHVEHRVLRTALHLSEGRDAGKRRYKGGPHLGAAQRARRVGEVEPLDAQEQQQHPGDEQGRPLPVEAGGFLVGLSCTTGGLRFAEKHRRGDRQRRAQGHCKEEHDVPPLDAHDADDGAAHRRAQHVCQACHCRSQPQRHAAFLGGERRGDRRVGHGYHAACARRLHHAPRKQEPKAAPRLRQAAQQRPCGEHGQACREHAAAPAPVGQLAHDGDEGGVEERVDVDHPDAGVVVQAKRRLHHRAHRRHHAHVKPAHEQSEQVEGQHDAEMGRARGTARLACARSAVRSACTRCAARLACVHCVACAACAARAGRAMCVAGVAASALRLPCCHDASCPVYCGCEQPFLLMGISTLRPAERAPYRGSASMPRP